MKTSKYYSIDLFAGCGGLTEGMKAAGFNTVAAVEVEPIAAEAYSLNHPSTRVLTKDIRTISGVEIKQYMDNKKLHLLAGCPPCQGFSTVRRLNKPTCAPDKRNDLVNDYFRLITELRPLTIMMENVPGLLNYSLFKDIMVKLEVLGYSLCVEIVNIKDYGVPQSRKRLVMVGSLLGNLFVAQGSEKKVSVRDAIGELPIPSESPDPLHQIVAKHTDKIMKRITLTPKNGGSRKDLPAEFTLACHMRKEIGFNDIYGRLRWDDHSSTITSGCLNPSKGRFLHPEQDRALTPREAALLQSFPDNYQFPANISKQALALLIGNALPPKFSYFQSKNILNHLKLYGV